ncbi:unnamed protein product, partial [Didymodactylos carnosus]
MVPSTAESADDMNSHLAPLASLETLSDVTVILSMGGNDAMTINGLKKSIPSSSTFDVFRLETSQEQRSNRDSFECQSDSPSPRIRERMSSSQTRAANLSQSSCRIRFGTVEVADEYHIITTKETCIDETKTEQVSPSSDNIRSQDDSINGAPISPQPMQISSQNIQSLTKRLSDVLSSPRQSLRNAAEGSLKKVLPGVVVTSSRSSRRRISLSAATHAFAIATSGESPKVTRHERIGSSTGAVINQAAREQNANEWIIVNTAATMRVLNVLRHWLTTYPLVRIFYIFLECKADFHKNVKLKEMVLELLQDMLLSNHLIATEHKAAVSIIKQLETDEMNEKAAQIQLLLNPSLPPDFEQATFTSLAVSEVAEQMTLIDHKLFCSLGGEELLLQGWMKARDDLAPNVALVSKRFNEMCRLVITEILLQPTINGRVQCIEKWGTIADICRYLRNFNGVLQIVAAFVNSAVFRLKNTWDRISKQNKQVINKLQNLVHSDGKFKNLRDTLSRVDPPAVPYLGLYLSDLSFIEESTPDISEK